MCTLDEDIKFLGGSSKYYMEKVSDCSIYSFRQASESMNCESSTNAFGIWHAAGIGYFMGRHHADCVQLKSIAASIQTVTFNKVR